MNANTQSFIDSVLADNARVMRRIHRATLHEPVEALVWQPNQLLYKCYTLSDDTHTVTEAETTFIDDDLNRYVNYCSNMVEEASYRCVACRTIITAGSDWCDNCHPVHPLYPKRYDYAPLTVECFTQPYEAQRNRHISDVGFADTIDIYTDPTAPNLFSLK